MNGTSWNYLSFEPRSLIFVRIIIETINKFNSKNHKRYLASVGGLSCDSYDRILCGKVRFLGFRPIDAFAPVPIRKIVYYILAPTRLNKLVKQSIVKDYR